MAAEQAPLRLCELAQRHDLGADQQEQLARLLSVLAADSRAPTSIAAPELAVDVHVADALTALELDAVRAARSVADLGSGAGLPGLALAVALVDATLWLLESQARKCAFIEAAAARMGLDNVRVVCTRAESWSDGAKRNDLVVARALAPQPVVLEYAAPLLRPGGSLVDFRGRREPEEEHEADLAAAELGLARSEVRRVRPYRSARDHHLHTFIKVEETPARFPRRPGMARKRPLGRPAGPASRRSSPTFPA